jgi:hypothetical protein
MNEENKSTEIPESLRVLAEAYILRVINGTGLPREQIITYLQRQSGEDEASWISFAAVNEQSRQKIDNQAKPVSSTHELMIFFGNTLYNPSCQFWIVNFSCTETWDFRNMDDMFGHGDFRDSLFLSKN